MESMRVCVCVYIRKTEKFRECVHVRVCVCVFACMLQWQLVFCVINDVLCDLISASEDQRLFQLDLVKVATPRRPLIIISIINPHYHRGMWNGCVISWSCTRTRSQAPNDIPKHNNILSHSQEHTHTLHSKLIWIMTVAVGTDCLFRLSVCFWELSSIDGGGISDPHCRHKCQNIILSLPPSFSFTQAHIWPHTHTHLTRTLGHF